MLTTRISPKISVKPLATTKNSAASVSPLSVTTAKRRGSSAPLTTRKATTATAAATAAMRPTVHAPPGCCVCDMP